MSLFQSIKGRLLIFSLCISLIPIFAITTMGYFHATRTLKKQTLEWLTAVAESRKIHAQSFMEAKSARAVDFGSDGFIRDTLETINRGGVGKGGAVIALSDYLSLEKWSLDPFITAIAVVDKGGRVVASTRKKIIGLDASGWEPFKEAINKKYHQTYISKPRNSPYLDAKCMFISTPVTSRKDGDTIGVIINAYDIVVLSLITANRAGMGETGEVYLVNSDGIMLTESRFTNGAPLQQVVDTEPIRKIAGGGVKMAGVYPDYRGVYIVGAAVYMPEYDWTLLAEIDQAEVFAPLRALRIVALVVGLVSVVIVVRVGVSFATSESRPIEELVDATRRLASGDLGHRVDIKRKDEIGVLADSFNTMADKLAGEIAVRKRGEEELRKLSSAVVQSPSTVIITDPEGNIEYVNPKFTQLTGYTIEEVIGKNPRILKSGKTPPEVYKDLWETITASGDWRGEFCNKKKNGELYWEYVSISPVRNTDGDITHFVAVKEDITERKRVEGALKESEEIFRNIGSSAQDAIIMADNGGYISYWNEAAEKLFDYSKEVAIGKDLHELI
ncbi:MAG: PAS domain S-box protein, partial [Candidatus Brocadiales bacterium]